MTIWLGGSTSSALVRSRATRPSRSSRAASWTRRNIAFRTMTCSTRCCWESARGGGGASRRAATGGGAAGEGGGCGGRLPLVEQGGVGLRDRLAEPLDEVVELGGPVRVGDGVAK